MKLSICGVSSAQLKKSGSTKLGRFFFEKNSQSGRLSFTKDINYIEVAFSPQDEVNDDIISQLGNFNIGNYIGDPRQVSSSLTSVSITILSPCSCRNIFS
jgi:hypothetical protein